MLLGVSGYSWCMLHMQTMRAPISLSSHPHNDEIKLPLHVDPSRRPVLMLADHPALVHASSCLFHREWGLVLPSKQRLPEYTHRCLASNRVCLSISASLALLLESDN